MDLQLDRAAMTFSSGDKAMRQELTWAGRGMFEGTPFAAYAARLPERFFWLGGFHRIDPGEPVSAADALFVAASVLPKYFCLADGQPLYMQCSRRHARSYVVFATKLNLKATIICGSLAGDPPVSDYSHDTGGSADEQIIALSKLDLSVQ